MSRLNRMRHRLRRWVFGLPPPPPPAQRPLLEVDKRYAAQLVSLIREGCVPAHDSFYQPEPAYDRGLCRAIEDSLPDLNVGQVIHLEIGRPGMSCLRVGKVEKRP